MLALIQSLSLVPLLLFGTQPGSPTTPPVAEPKADIGLSAADWSGIRSAHDAFRFAVAPFEGGFRVSNPGQAWVAVFDGRGFLVTPDGGSWTWGLELERYGFAGCEIEVGEPSGASAEGGRVTYAWGGQLEEWFVNDGRGLEHGFTLAQRPAGAGTGGSSELTLTLAVRGNLEPEVDGDGRGVRFMNTGGVAALSYTGLIVFDADGRDLPARFERSGGRLRLSIDESGARYPLTIDPVAQQAYLKSSNTNSWDLFGQSVAISGDRVLIGAPGEESSATGVDGNQSDNSKYRAGAAYLFVRQGQGWIQEAYLKASNTGGGDEFGQVVALSGDTAVVGAWVEDSAATGINGNQADNSSSGAGAVYVFRRSGNSWAQEAYLKASNAEAGDIFGASVALDGDSLVVGAPRESSGASGVNGNQSDNSAYAAGAAYVFVRSGSTWTQEAYLKASNPDGGWVGPPGFPAILGDGFGSGVSISGDTLVVGAGFEDSSAQGVGGNQLDNSSGNAGAAYVFVRNGATWTQQAYLKASNTEPVAGKYSDLFGNAIVSGDTIVVVATREASASTGVDGDPWNNDAPRAGAAYVFVRTGSTWAQQAYLKASNTESVDYFGGAVDLVGDRILIGATSEGSAANGIGGNPSDNSAPASGAAYLFERSGSTWTQTAYIKASNSDAFDLFGRSVALSPTTAVIGASAESSAATGINGDQQNNTANTAGAAYIFDLAPTCGSTRYGTYTGANTADLYSATTPTQGTAFTFDLSAFNGSGTAMLVVSVTEANTALFGGTLYVDLAASIFGPALFTPVSVSAGSGQISLPIPAGTQGLVLYAQAAMADPLQPMGLIFSNGLQLTICP